MTNPSSAPPLHDEPSRSADGASGDPAVGSTVDAADTAAPATVTFTLPIDIEAQHASVVGDFNGWDPARGVMQRDGAGAFSCSLEVMPGTRYQYRFLLDGDRWVNDWSAEAYAPNEFGGEDSVLDLSADGNGAAAD